MARPASRYPTERELQILKILWRHGPLKGREVRDALARDTNGVDLAHTSVLTFLKIMVRKGYVRRAKLGGSHVYQARPREETVKRGMLKDLVARVFDGSALTTACQLIDTTQIDEQEMQRLRQIVDRHASRRWP